MRITCPQCSATNRAKRKTCRLCGTSIEHLRTWTGPARQPRTSHRSKRWPANGSHVSVIRSRHGWHDGRVTGTLIQPGIVQGDDGYTYEIESPRDLQ